MRLPCADGQQFDITVWETGVQAGLDELFVGDFNGDGRDDVASHDTGNGKWYMSISQGSSFETTQWGTWSIAAWDVQVTDLNGDGRDDLAGYASSTGDWYVTLSSGSALQPGSNWDTWSASSTWLDTLVGDFDGDGREDVAARESVTGDWRVAFSTGTSFAPQSAWGNWDPAKTWTDVRVADVNGDGLDDIVGRDGAAWQAGLGGASGFTNDAWGSSTSSYTGRWSTTSTGMVLTM